MRGKLIVVLVRFYTNSIILNTYNLPRLNSSDCSKPNYKVDCWNDTRCVIDAHCNGNVTNGTLRQKGME